MWTFEEPAYLLFLLGLPLLIVLKHGWKGRGGRLVFPLGLWKGLKFQPFVPGMRISMAVSNLCLWLCFACVIIALAGPSLTRKDKVYMSAGTDIMVVLDESPSMGARDFPPRDRFTAAKGVIERFVKGRRNDLIGLVSFGKEASLRVPLTLDYSFLLQKLNSLQLMELGDGTALGMGISLAALHLQNSQAPQKVIIILTDGENNAGEVLPATAADLARSMGISLYIIGIGTAGVVPVDVVDPRTGKAYSGTLEGGFHEEAMKALAVPPQGAYFSASSPGSLETIFMAIDSRESSSKRVKVQVFNEPLYRNFLFAAFGCLVVFFILRKLTLKEIL